MVVKQVSADQGPLVDGSDSDEKGLEMKRAPSQNAVSMWGATAILSSYCVSSSTAIMPFVFGYLGFVGGPLMMGIFFWVCSTLQKVVLDISLANPGAHTMPESAAVAIGPRAGRLAYFCQFLNQQLCLPAYLLFVIKSLKETLYPLGSHTDGLNLFPEWTRCNILWLVVPLLPAVWAINSQRSFQDSGRVCQVTAIVNVVQVCIIVAVVMSNPHGTTDSLAPSAPLLGTNFALNNDTTSQGYWVKVFQAMALFNYCYEPCFIATEVMHEMKDKRQMKKSLDIATWTMFAIYCAAGVVPVYFWGWQRRENGLQELGHGKFAVLANICLLLPSSVDFLVTAISLNKMALEVFDPGIDINDWGAGTRAKWFFVSLPAMMVTLALLCFVPRITTLLGLLTSCVIPTAQLLLPAAMAIMASRRHLLGRSLTSAEYVAIAMGVNIGLLSVVLGSSSTFYVIFFQSDFNGSFFCELVAG